MSIYRTAIQTVLTETRFMYRFLIILFRRKYIILLQSTKCHLSFLLMNEKINTI